MGSIVTISGPRGIGKTEIMGRLHQKHGIAPIVPYTTRAQRNGEKDGVDYRFVDLKTFNRIRDERPMFDVLPLNGSFYGTPLADFYDVLDGREKGVRTVNLAAKSALELRARMKARGHGVIKSLFLLPASWEDIERQMRAAGIPRHKIMERRGNEPTDLTLLPKFDHIVVNEFGHVEETVRSIARFIGATLGKR